MGVHGLTHSFGTQFMYAVYLSSVPDYLWVCIAKIDTCEGLSHTNLAYCTVLSLATVEQNYSARHGLLNVYISSLYIIELPQRL